MMVTTQRRAADACYKCGESRGAINNEALICWDGYDELGKHQFVITTKELAMHDMEKDGT